MIRARHLLSLAALAVLIPFAGPANADEAVAVNVLDGNPDRIVIEYEFGEFTSRTVRIDGRPFIEVYLEGESVKKELGAPALPDVSRSVIIPDDARMAVRVLEGRYYETKDIDVAPSKGILYRDVNPDDVPYTFGRTYATNAFYPGELATLREPHILRDYRGIAVTVHPFQYNPVTRVLRVYTSMTIEVTAVGKDRVNVLKRRPQPRALSLAFHQLYESHFINYNMEGRYDPLDEMGDMLIICHDAWLGNIQPFADHKNSIGITTSVVGVSTIGNNSAAIKNYIQGVYDTSDLAFVLLVGDDAQVRSYQLGGSASDPTYSKLEGGDDYPDIMVGRFSAESPGDVDTQVQRSIDYENMPATEQDWFWKGMGVASNQGAGIGDDGESDDQHQDNLRLLLLGYGYTEVDQIYDPYGTAQMVSNGLNAGRGMVNYTGHGWPQGWGSTGFDNNAVNALQNDNMLPVITSVACNTGQFDDYTCFGEAWLRATHNGQPTGGVGFYGSTISQSWAPPMQMQDEYIDLYVAEFYKSWGTYCYAGSCSMMDDYGSSGVNEFNYWTIFGDPSLCVTGTVMPPTGMKVGPGKGLNSEGPNGGPFTPESMIYTLTNYDPTPLDYTVSKIADWIDLDSTGGTIPVGGYVEVTVSISDAANDMGNGHYEDIVEFTNTTNHDGDTTRVVTLDIGVPMPVHVYSMDSDPGWAMSGQWAFGQPTGQGGTQHGYPDPTGGATGVNVCGVNLSGDYSTTPGGPYYLTTGAIDCAELTKVQLHFQRWLNTDYQPYVYATLDVSTDGVNWESLFNNGGNEIAENSWSEHVYDLSAIADNQPTLYLRWGYEIGSGAYAYSGWNIDDVAIWGVEPTPDCPCDINGDGVVNTEDLLILLGNWGGSGDGDVDNNGVVNTADLLALLADWGECP
jgi:hypothetical protein